jgi:beta-lactam-binding protein with PASTA domain
VARNRNINRNKKDKEKKKAKSLVALGVTAAISVFLAALLGVGVLMYYFAPQKSDAVTVNVPSYLGIDEKNAMSDSQFLIEKEWVESDNAQRGKVISQYPSANSARKLYRGERVTVTLRIGAGKQKNAVPDVAGRDYMSAASMLRAMGARVRTVSVYDGEGENGRVLYSLPRESTPLERGQTVTLFVKKTRVKMPVQVPDLVGKTMESACAEILQKGLLLGSVEYEYSSDEEGTVILQSLPCDVYVVHGTRIDITVGLGASDAQSESREETETQTEEGQARRHPFKFFGFG